MPELAVTAEEAHALIAAKAGFTEDPETGCWIYDYLPATGWGPYLAFWLATYGEPPAGMEVYHVCAGGPRGCVRPSHLDCGPDGGRAKRARRPPIAPDAAATFARALREERESRRQTRREFAADLRVSPSTVEAWETGARQPTADMARKLAAEFGWGGPPRRWVVTFVHEAVVVAASSGQAARIAMDAVTGEARIRKTALYNVRPAK